MELRVCGYRVSCGDRLSDVLWGEEDLLREEQLR